MGAATFSRIALQKPSLFFPKLSSWPPSEPYIKGQQYLLPCCASNTALFLPEVSALVVPFAEREVQMAGPTAFQTQLHWNTDLLICLHVWLPSLDVYYEALHSTTLPSPGRALTFVSSLFRHDLLHEAFPEQPTLKAACPGHSHLLSLASYPPLPRDFLPKYLNHVTLYILLIYLACVCLPWTIYNIKVHQGKWLLLSYYPSSPLKQRCSINT